MLNENWLILTGIQGLNNNYCRFPALSLLSEDVILFSKLIVLITSWYMCIHLYKNVSIACNFRQEPGRIKHKCAQITNDPVYSNNWAWKKATDSGL